MVEYDLVVLGGGTGNRVASEAADAGMDVALVECDSLGETCLNRGCNPSKKLIHRADVAETIRTAKEFGTETSLEDIAFERIIEEVTEIVTAEAAAKADCTRDRDNITFYQTVGRFVDDRIVEVDVRSDGDEGAKSNTDTDRLAAPNIVLAGGSRPIIPDSIDGVQTTEFLTSADALRLTDLPDRLVIVGGRGDVLLRREDPEIARRLTEVCREKYELRLGFEVREIREEARERIVTAENDAGEELEVLGDRVLLAVGRRPNSDRWNVSAAGIETDDAGFVETDDYLRTSAEGVYAIGDIAGNYMFKHSGDKEAAHVIETIVRGGERPVAYPDMAHAVFGSPQVASLGRTEPELDDEGVDYGKGTCMYDDTALGTALRNESGFAKVLVGSDGEVLGCHIVGPEASTLIHEVSTAVAAGANARSIAETIHVHPALSEVVQGAFRDVCDGSPSGV
ncbi:dihydrolipoyl dehydrogenase family protein (plasmid) [Haloferacaceae archaeon DSL9]